MSKSEIKRDCYFFNECTDMGAIIPSCSYINPIDIDNCNCKDCIWFISRQEVRQIVKNHLMEVNKEGDNERKDA